MTTTPSPDSSDSLTSDPVASTADHLPRDCEHVLERVYEFLDHELDTASGDAIRRHLADCEPCLDAFDLEQAVKSLVNRSCGGDTAPSRLRSKVLDQIAASRHVPGS